MLRGGVVDRLRPRLSEIVRAVHVGVETACSAPSSDESAACRGAVAAVVEYALDGLRVGPTWRAPIPAAALVHVRLAASLDISLGTVLRRYLAGHQRFCGLVDDEATASNLSSDALRHLRDVREALLDHLLASVEWEYVRERERQLRTPAQRRAEIAKRLLSGEALDSTDLAEFDHDIHIRWHLGFVAIGAGAEGAFRRLSLGVDRKLLVLPYNGMVWAWLTGRHSQTSGDIQPLTEDRPAELYLAVGEPAKGIDGWRLTHYQARAALAVALRSADGFAQYADSRLLAAALQNDTLAKSLEHRYLEPLCGQRDEGARLRQTLRTYIDLECNATSAAHALKVGRRAVSSRVSRAEMLIGCTLRECLAELDVALRLAELMQAGAGA